ncbi:GM13972 [Drosophila sechellia]|uniref:GM13972 n=1 Tax=Drosophila sechellia TaxID=7238 RepID=B4HU70_DROSE|nr:GM13972 [Drosophila sechellia]
MGVVLRELRSQKTQRRQQQPVNQTKQKFLIAFALVAVASADVSHLFSHSNNLQEDGYHYAPPRAPVVIDVPYVPHESAPPVVVYEAPKPRPTPPRPVYTPPVVFHSEPAGVLKDDGYHYGQPSVKFEVSAPLNQRLSTCL